MKRILFFLIVLPLTVFAHRDDPRVRKEAPYAGVKSVKTITFFTLPKENNKLDTCSVETDVYNTDGLLTQHDYSMILPKSPRYDYQEKFTYSAEDAWTKRVYKSGRLTDSVVVKASWANWYFFSAGKMHALYEYRADSMQEKMINGGDTLVRPKKPGFDLHRDEFWDYANAGSFAAISVSRSVNGPDTVSYLDETGKCLVRHITQYNSSGAVASTDYYNYGVKTFHFRRLTYSENMDMTFFLKKSKKGQWSYRILYTYNDKGQLIGEKWDDGNPRHNQVVKKYEYVFY